MTMRPIDHTHSIDLKSWVESANLENSDFPIQNLPFCLFHTADDFHGIGVGIGDQILDLSQCKSLFDESLQAYVDGHNLAGLMEAPVSDRIAVRHRISELLSASCPDLKDNATSREVSLIPQKDASFLVPTDIRDYTDFYASVFHATNVGSMFRPNNPLLPNYKHIPIGYHGRASSIVISGHDVQRPVGQLSPSEEGGMPSRGPCKMLDYEMEVGFFVGTGNALGEEIPIEKAEDHLFGLCLVNDWSARDMQKWEYQPLGPFLAKSFATTISPWVVTMEALAPFRCPVFERPEGDPQPLDYLNHADNQAQGGVDVRLQVSLTTAKMREGNQDPHVLSRGNFRDMYWTIAQMLTHHSSNGCNLQPGDLMASGTVSNRERTSRGCLLELTWDGDLDNPVAGSQRTPIELDSGESRVFLADGDEVVMSGYCEREGYRRIGFGECRGTIIPAATQP